MNSLQLNNGVTKDGDLMFSEISRLAGVSRTDWSWSALFADFDNDGLKDIFITNGYPKAVNDLDYQTRMMALRSRDTGGPAQKARLDLLKQLPAYSEPNYLFQNGGDLTFTDKTKEWGIERPGFSYGAAYADLDNDGKLDLVVNNIDAPAFIYHNVAPTDSAHHYLDVRLVGEPQRQRSAAIGARLTVTAGGQKQYLYYSPYRGYMSAMETPAHFGLGSAARADTLEIEWPDGRYQVLTNVAADTLLVVQKANATQTKERGTAAPSSPRFFEPVAPPRAPVYKHQASNACRLQRAGAASVHAFAAGPADRRERREWRWAGGRLHRRHGGC